MKRKVEEVEQEIDDLKAKISKQVNADCKCILFYFEIRTINQP
jgi:hypothetical protein